MATQVSPGIKILEVDKTLAISQVALTEGAIAGYFKWGPVDTVRTVSTEDDLVKLYWKPDNASADYFFTAANFLSYSNTLRVVRIVNASTAKAATSVAKTVAVAGTYGSNSANLKILTANTGNTSALYAGLGIDVVDGSNTYPVTVSAVLNTTAVSLTTALPAGFAAANAYPYGEYIKNEDDYESSWSLGTATTGPWGAKYVGSVGNSLRVELCASANAYKQTPTQGIVASSTTVYTNGNVAGIMQVGDIVKANGEKRSVTAVATDGLSFTVNSAFTYSLGSTLSGFTVSMNTTNTIVNVVSGNAQTSIVTGYKLFIGSANTGVIVDTVTNGTSFTVTAIPSASATANTVVLGSSFTREWKYASIINGAPGTSTYVSNLGGSKDELHAVVVDEDGVITGVPGQVLEKYEYLSKASDARTAAGGNNYYKDAINKKSPYVWWLGHPSNGGNWGSAAAGVTFDAPVTIDASSLYGGVDGSGIATADLQRGYDLLADEQVEASFILGASADSTLATYIIGNIIEPKQFAMGFFSPDKSAVVNNVGNEADDIISYRNRLPSTSYAVLDSGWKYQYDKYNDVYRYVPLNGDVAGCAVRADQTAESWFSPAGFSRGQIKNVVKLAYNPNQTNRDDLYRSGVNPVVSFPGQGTVLFGDKTLLDKPSAFDRINVRRLFIVLEKTIERSAKQQLFEQNDDATRQGFVSLVEPYLRSVKGRRGITDYLVVCDSTNNPGDAIDRGEFRADIYVKPVRSINFIQLSFVAVRSDVAFNEVVTNLG